VNRNPIDSLHGENSEQRTKCEPESRGATRRGPKQERNREAGVVNLLYGQIRLFRRPHFAGQLQRVCHRGRHSEGDKRDGDDMQHLKQRFFPSFGYFCFLRVLPEFRLRIRFESRDFALSSSERRERDRPRPARLMK